MCVAVGKNDVVPNAYKEVFDHIVITKDVGLKYPMANEWQVFNLTPYKETIHVEADCLFTSNNDWWWQELQQHELFFTSHVKDYRGKTSTSNFYRKHFDKKGLPNYTMDVIILDILRLQTIFLKKQKKQILIV